jgi:hypothetical protein
MSDNSQLSDLKIDPFPAPSNSRNVTGAVHGRLFELASLSIDLPTGTTLPATQRTNVPTRSSSHQIDTYSTPYETGKPALRSPSATWDRSVSLANGKLSRERKVRSGFARFSSMHAVSASCARPHCASDAT